MPSTPDYPGGLCFCHISQVRNRVHQSTDGSTQTLLAYMCTPGIRKRISLRTLTVLGKLLLGDAPSHLSQ